MFFTFEDQLFPQNLRLDYALGNVASDATVVSKALSETFHEQAQKFFPQFRSFEPRPRIGQLSLLLPVGCNAACPTICYTDVTNWKQKSEDLKPEQILDILEEFKTLGGKVIRIIGVGEPTLYRQLPQLCKWTRKNRMHLIIFSNGLEISKTMIEEYQKGRLYIYLKLWSETTDVQNQMVAPRRPYVYSSGIVGNAPRSFYELWEVDSRRVGFQVMFSRTNFEDATRIISGPKSRLPLFIDPFLASGAGAGHEELISPALPAETKHCSKPPRASYLAVINNCGELQPGTFINDEAVPITDGRLAETWRTVFATKNLFFEARYSDGCFCESKIAEL